MPSSTVRRDPVAESPRASEEPDFAEIEARDLLASAIRIFPGNLPMARMAFEALVLSVCSGAVANAIEESGGGGSARATFEIIARLHTEISAMPNPLLALRCMAIVFSLPCGEGESQTDLAREFGVTKGDVSATCIALCDRFGVPPGRGMKREPVRAVYAGRQAGKRARPMPVKWPFAGLFRELAKPVSLAA